jgi:hypothetical protein
MYGTRNNGKSAHLTALAFSAMSLRGLSASPLLTRPVISSVKPRRSKYKPHQGKQEIQRRADKIHHLDPVYFQDHDPEVAISNNPCIALFKNVTLCWE